MGGCKWLTHKGDSGKGEIDDRREGRGIEGGSIEGRGVIRRGAAVLVVC